MAGIMLRAAQGVVNALWPRAGADSVNPWSRSGGGPSSAYEGASTRRRMRGWSPRVGSPSVLLAAEGETLRDRARDLVRNNPWAAAASEQFVTDLVGRGMRPWWGGLPKAQRVALKSLWTQWIDDADSTGSVDFYGLQAVAMRAVFDTGECFIRIRERRLSDGFAVPLQLELLPSDMVPMGHTRMVESTGNLIRQGIEFNRIGQIVRYWFHPRHPGDFVATRPGDAREYVPVPADQVIHLFRQTEPGQVRGVTGLSSVLRRLRALDFYDDAENERKGLASSIVGFLRRTEGYEPTDAAQPSRDNAGRPSVDTVEPWTIGTLLPLGDNEDVTFPELPTAGDYDRYMPMQLRAIASGTGRLYTHMSQDLRGESYSSARVSLINLARKVRAEQQRVLEHQLCRVVMQRWIRQAVLARAIPLPGYDQNPYPFENPWWVPDGFEWVDPERQVRAATQECRSGFDARVLVLLRRGLDPDEVDDLNETDVEDQDKREISYDTDGRRPWTGQKGAPGDTATQQAGAADDDGGEQRQRNEEEAA
jgi:lambda family phage portal protein